MCWVKAEFYRGGGGIEVKLNLGIAIAVEDHGDHFKINYAGEEGYYSVKKTPEMVEAYNSLVPVKSQPVVPAESEDDWVVQDQVPVRVGIDQYRYVLPDGLIRIDWRLAVSGDRWDGLCTHGWVDEDGDTLELRCRRRDLPVKQEEPFRITGLGLYRTAEGDVVRINHKDASDPLVAWRSDKGQWFTYEGTRYFGYGQRFNIVKLIKLDEVQP
jgi:hypothetical protein